MPFYSTSRT